MSCNGCRVLRKGCSESCVLRPCLQWIDGADSQGHATLFVAKFFGRAGLMSFISAVPESKRPALFQSLLFEACGRTINPINGAVGLMWTGNWKLCQAAVETVLRGETVRPMTDLIDAVENTGDDHGIEKRWGFNGGGGSVTEEYCDLDLCLTPRSTEGSVTTSAESVVDRAVGPSGLLNLFV